MADERDDAHTPTPWLIGYKDHNSQAVIVSDDANLEIATCWHHSVGALERQMEANARLIVRAVNQHAALQQCAEALRALVPDMAGHPDDYTTEWHDAKDALAALTAAEAGE